MRYFEVTIEVPNMGPTEWCRGWETIREARTERDAVVEVQREHEGLRIAYVRELHPEEVRERVR